MGEEGAEGGRGWWQGWGEKGGRGTAAAAEAVLCRSGEEHVELGLRRALNMLPCS